MTIVANFELNKNRLANIKGRKIDVPGFKSPRARRKTSASPRPSWAGAARTGASACATTC